MSTGRGVDRRSGEHLHVAVVHTDLRAYWPARLAALARALGRRNTKLSIVEIAGRGAPYDFGKGADGPEELNRHVLFPEGDLRHLSPLAMARSVRRKLDELNPDIVMAGSVAFPSGAAAVRWARHRHRSVVVFDDARLQDVPRSGLVNYVKRRLYANVDAAFIPAESHRESYLRWGVPKERIFLGVDVIDSAWFAEKARALRRDLEGFRGDQHLPARFFLGVGRHIPQKNWPMCLAAYALYQQRVGKNAWGLVLIGDGPDRAGLAAVVAQQGIRNVHFPGAIYGEELIRFYVAAGALVLPSKGETWGLVVNEAMVCGLPVLVSERCGCAETLVRDGVNGWRFSPDDPRGLAERMTQISSLSDPEYQRMTCASQEIVRPWGLERFVQGAEAAIAACRQVHRGFASPLDRLLISLWNGRFRPI